MNSRLTLGCILVCVALIGLCLLLTASSPVDPGLATHGASKLVPSHGPEGGGPGRHQATKPPQQTPLKSQRTGGGSRRAVPQELRSRLAKWRQPRQPSFETRKTPEEQTLASLTWDAIGAKLSSTSSRQRIQGVRALASMKPINKAAGLLLQAILDEQAMVGLEEKEQHTDRNGMTWSRGDVGHDLVGEAIAFLSEMGGVGLSRMIELARRTNDARILGFIPQYLAIHDSDSRAIDLLERLALTNERRQADVAGSIGDVGTSAVLVLGQINSSRGRRALRTILGSDISRQKRLTAISFLTHEDSRDFLQKLYYQERGSLRASVVDALASFTDHGTLRIVENAMYSSVPVVSRAAKRSLASMRGEDPVGLQIQLCNRGCEEGIRLKAAVNISRHKRGRTSFDRVATQQGSSEPLRSGTDPSERDRQELPDQVPPEHSSCQYCWISEVEAVVEH